MLRLLKRRANSPFSRLLNSSRETKAPSDVGRYWWNWVDIAALRSVSGSRARRRDSFSETERVFGMLRWERRALNWIWASGGNLGWAAGLLDQMQALFIIDCWGGRERS